MAINGKTKTVVDGLLTDDSTTEASFKTGIKDVTTQIETLNSDVDTLEADVNTAETAIANLQTSVQNVETNISNGITTASANLGSWTILPSGSYLYFQYGGNSVMRLDSSGNLVVEGNITAYQGV